MPHFKIDDLDFNSEDLTPAGAATLRSLQFTAQKIKVLQAEILSVEAERKQAIAKLKGLLSQTRSPDA
jgi:hypothetical protein